MRTTRRLPWALGGIFLAVTSLCAWGEDTDFEQPLVQARFDHLIPTSYPTFSPSFRRLKPTTEPLIHPGIPTVHITENLTQAFSEPLLITSVRPRPIVTTGDYRAISLPGKPPRSRSLITSPILVPAKAKAKNSKLDRQQR